MLEKLNSLQNNNPEINFTERLTQTFPNSHLVKVNSVQCGRSTTIQRY